LPAILCAVAGVLLFQFFGNATRGYIDTASLFWWWISQWLDPAAETQHGWFILAVAVGLFAWNLRDDEGSPSTPLRAGKVQGAGGRDAVGEVGKEQGGHWMRLAVAALAVGLVLHLVGFAVQQSRVSILALLAWTWGVLALAGGARWGRAAAFPVAFMVFAIPLNVLDSVGFWLRMGVIDATEFLAHGVGIEVLRSGTQLLSPDGRYQYDVAAACSGVRSLMALTALSLLVGYLRFRPGWIRGGLFLLSFPLVYLGNIVRISAIVLAAQWGGQDWGSRVHDWMGFLVFLVVLGGVMIAASLLQRLGRPEWVRGDPTIPWRDLDLAPGSVRAVPMALLAIVLVAAGAEAALLGRLADRPMQADAGIRLAADGVDPVELPTFLGTEWIGRRTEVTAIEREILPPDTGFSRKVYVPLTDPSKAVLLSLVLSGRDRTSIHRPELCLVGQGFTVLSARTHVFAYPGLAGDGFPATVLEVEREVPTTTGYVTVPQLVAYWFVGRDQVVAGSWQRVLQDAWNRLRLRTDRWAYVLVQTDARDGEEAALARMQEVLDQTLPAFQLVTGKD